MASIPSGQCAFALDTAFTGNPRVSLQSTNPKARFICRAPSGPNVPCRSAWLPITDRLDPSENESW